MVDRSDYEFIDSRLGIPIYMTYEEIAKELGISRSLAQQIASRAIQKIRSNEKLAVRVREALRKEVGCNELPEASVHGNYRWSGVDAYI